MNLMHGSEIFQCLLLLYLGQKSFFQKSKIGIFQEKNGGMEAMLSNMFYGSECFQENHEKENSN